MTFSKNQRFVSVTFPKIKGLFRWPFLKSKVPFLVTFPILKGSVFVDLYKILWFEACFLWISWIRMEILLRLFGTWHEPVIVCHVDKLNWKEAIRAGISGEKYSKITRFYSERKEKRQRRHDFSSVPVIDRIHCLPVKSLTILGVDESKGHGVFAQLENSESAQLGSVRPIISQRILWKKIWFFPSERLENIESEVEKRTGNGIDVLLAVFDEVGRTNHEVFRRPVLRCNFDMLQIVIVTANVRLHTILVEQWVQTINQALGRSVLGYAVHWVMSSDNQVIRPKKILF
jgi:hypothetical protein